MTIQRKEACVLWPLLPERQNQVYMHAPNVTKWTPNEMLCMNNAASWAGAIVKPVILRGHAPNKIAHLNI